MFRGYHQPYGVLLSFISVQVAAVQFEPQLRYGYHMIYLFTHFKRDQSYSNVGLDFVK